eukprot:GFKZ01010238.1.p1 GENE.GFKZ01010238.1~~GFKZ01010238.1.p1  ORF type:complete len:762 (-),score=110.06 GFKZ01010238.1:1346-3568(-)
MQQEQAQRTLESAARRALASALSPLPGPKALLVDPTLYIKRLSIASPLDLFTDPTFLREHGIRAIAPLTPAPASNPPINLANILSIPSIILIIRGINPSAARSAVNTIRTIRDAVKQENQTSPDPPTKFLILTTPRRSITVEKIIHHKGLHDVPIAPLPLGFLPFDADLVTLDWPDAYRQVVLEGDYSALVASAAALSSLSSLLHLEYTTIRTAGAAATAVAEELLQTQGQMYALDTRDSVGGSPESSVASSPIVGRGAFVSREALIGALRPLEESEEGEEDDDGMGTAAALGESVELGRKRRSVNLVIIDRGVDAVTPMLTQGTYEGLLEESVWVHNNVMDLPISAIASEDAMNIFSSASGSAGAGAVRKRLRGDVDPIFAELRDQNYYTAARQIGSVVNSVQEYYKARPGRETAEISQVREYVKGLKDVKSEHASATVHMAIAYEIMARTFNSYDFKRRYQFEKDMMEGSAAAGRKVYVGDMIARGESLCHVLRLCCLWSLTSSGIDDEEYDFIRKEILAIFGLGVLPLLVNLERSGMFVRSMREQQQTNLSWIPFANFGGSDTGSVAGSVSSVAVTEDGRRYRTYRGVSEYSWQFARAALRLLTDFDVDKPVTPGSGTAVAAPYSGYTPLSVRLVEAGLSEEGWGGLPHIASHNSLLPPGHATVEHRRGNLGQSLLDGDDGIDTVIVFVGGIARAEASAVRRAAQARGVRALIATTAVMSPDDFVMSLTDTMRNDLK